MSRTLADVGTDQVYRDIDGDYVWKDYGNTAIIRRSKDGRIHGMGLVGCIEIKITGDCLGTSADEPWRKADAGSLADAHNRIDALQARLDALEQRPSGIR